MFACIFKINFVQRKSRKILLFCLFSAGCNCDSGFQVFSEKLPHPYHLTSKMYLLEVVCLLSLCLFDNVRYKNAY